MAVPSSSVALHLTGNLAFFVGGMPVTALTGAFVKSVTSTGLVTYQDASGVEQTAQLSVGSGATVTTSFVDPTGGAEGDLHFKVDALGMILSIWFRSNVQWAELGLPAGGVADGTVLNGNGPPAGNSGENGDSYRDDESGAWYKKASGAWSAALYTPVPGVPPATTVSPAIEGRPAVVGTDETYARRGHGHFGIGPWHSYS